MIASEPRPAALVVLSDGNATAGDTERALKGAANAGIPVLWRTVAATSSTPRIADVLAPARARPAQPVPVTVRLAGVAERPLRLTITAHDGSAEPVTSAIDAGPLGTATLRVTPRTTGPLLLDVELADPTASRNVDSKRLAAVIDVQPPADVLYVADGPSALAHSLQAGGWQLTSIASRGLDAMAAAFGQYAAVILDDVPASAARPATWDTLASAVRDRGVGLLVLGGGHSFAAGSYRDSRLEQVLPVLSHPSALGDAAALAFVVDKSGSMGASAAGVDRFRLAQRAVVETAATLTERDAAALIVFDVQRAQSRADAGRSAIQAGRRGAVGRATARWHPHCAGHRDGHWTTRGRTREPSDPGPRHGRFHRRGAGRCAASPLVARANRTHRARGRPGRGRHLVVRTGRSAPRHDPAGRRSRGTPGADAWQRRNAARADRARPHRSANVATAAIPVATGNDVAAGFRLRGDLTASGCHRSPRIGPRRPADCLPPGRTRARRGRHLRSRRLDARLAALAGLARSRRRPRRMGRVVRRDARPRPQRERPSSGPADRRRCCRRWNVGRARTCATARAASFRSQQHGASLPHPRQAERARFCPIPNPASTRSPWQRRAARND